MSMNGDSGEESGSHQQSWRSANESTEGDALDRELGAVLAKYAAVEPRAGLEDRILASLLVQPDASMARGWWGWATAGAVALLVLAVGMALFRTTERPGLAKPPDQAAQRGGHVQAEHSPVISVIPARPEASIAMRAKRSRRSSAVVANTPRLPQFPSPEPLTELEKTLARYVAKYPEHAALIAEARTEELRRNEEEMAEPMSGNESSGEQQ